MEMQEEMRDFEREWEKMLGGEVYDAVHPEFLRRLEFTRGKLWEYNNLHPGEVEKRNGIIREILGGCGERFHINQPFRCDYGCNIFIGEDFFANFNLTILDEATVRIGAHAFIGPNVSIYTACHPLDAESRNTCVEWAEPVTIGDNVWIGGNAVILPGVSLGDNVVVGAGAVVTKSFPSNVVIAGNPAKIIKEL